MAGAWFPTYGVPDTDRLNWAIDNSLALLSQELGVPVPNWGFSNDPQGMEEFNAVYYPGTQKIVFFRANALILAHEFGHHFSAQFHREEEFTKDEHERRADDFADKHFGLIYPIWRSAGLA